MRRILLRLVKSLALTVGLAAGLVTCARCGAWTPEPGHGEIIVTTLFDQANVGFNQAGRFTPTPSYRTLQLGAYVEVGVTEGVAALLKPSLQSSTLQGSTGGVPENQRYTGLGDSEIGVQARLWRDESGVLAMQADVRAPSTAGATDNWLAGSKAADFDLRLLLGKNVAVGAFAAFVDLSGGFRFCGGPAPNEAHADLTFGLYLTPGLMLLGQSFNIQSAPSKNPGFPQWAQSKTQFSLVSSLNDDWRVQFGGFTTVAGHNAYRETGALLAVWRRF
jgi:protein XagA